MQSWEAVGDLNNVVRHHAQQRACATTHQDPVSSTAAAAAPTYHARGALGLAHVVVENGGIDNRQHAAPDGTLTDQNTHRVQQKQPFDWSTAPAK